MYQETTHGFRVVVEPTFVPEQSNPAQHQFTYSYKIRIVNEGGESAQLKTRHWIIRDGNGSEREITGEGVVGEQPTLAPGQAFEYQSFCPLSTPTGNMRGTFRMEGSGGESFEIRVPLFFLRDTSLLH